MKRTQIYLAEEHATQLDERAASGGTTRSELIRRAVDAYLRRPDEVDEWRARWKAAVEATAGIAPHLPRGREYGSRCTAASDQPSGEPWRRSSS